jgi:hypothetical protein
VLVAAAVCPHPPLLVPQAASGAAAEMDDVRAACDTAVRALASGRPDLIVVAGGVDAGQAEFGGEAAGSLAGFGIDWSTGDGPPVLPLSLTIGRWLLERNGLLPAAPARASAAVLLRAVPFGAPPAACLALGEDLAGRARRVAMLVMGDGSARRSTKAPGYLDSRAQRYDADVAAALASADPGQLARLDPALAADLLVAGRAAWQVLAGAAAGSQFRGQLHRVAAPYGVGYFVASWKPI